MLHQLRLHSKLVKKGKLIDFFNNNQRFKDLTTPKENNNQSSTSYQQITEISAEQKKEIKN